MTPATSGNKGLADKAKVEATIKDLFGDFKP
jgi:hypothetical protein